MTAPDLDPAELIRESYRIEGITAPECRAIFMDWALRLPDGADIAAAAAEMLKRYGEPGHPMTAILSEALGPGDGPGHSPGHSPGHGPRRRGGALGRRR